MSNESDDFLGGPNEGRDIPWPPRLMAIRQTVEEIGQDLKWDDDWMPVVFVEGIAPAGMPGVKPEDIGKETTIVMGVGSGIMDSGEGKDFLAEIMFAAAIKMKATAMTFLSTAWLSALPRTPEDLEAEKELDDEQLKARMLEEAKAFRDRVGTPSQDPNRREVIHLVSVEYGGENDGAVVALAEIIRTEGCPPKLKGWRLRADAGMCGRFPDAIYEGLKIAADIREKEAK